ncbi:MAG TPA: hypothetical protein VKM37_08480 [Balneolaceae bacterium]|nr:hypothetical protein [Balneolaceae bacterium]
MIRKLALLIFLMIPLTVSAQFSGVVNYDVYNPQSSTGEVVNINMAFSENRVAVDSNISMNLMAGLRARGVYVRHDLSDFVVVTTDDEGIKITKSELDNLVGMINQFQGRKPAPEQKPFDWGARVRETGETKDIHGYQSVEFELDGDREDEVISVWLTDRIKVDWGLLLDAWMSVGASQFDQEIPIEILMNANSFPLLVEVNRGGRVIYRAESTGVSSPLTDLSQVNVPQGLKLLGISDLMMNFFRQQ